MLFWIQMHSPSPWSLHLLFQRLPSVKCWGQGWVSLDSGEEPQAQLRRRMYSVSAGPGAVRIGDSDPVLMLSSLPRRQIYPLGSPSRQLQQRPFTGPQCGSHAILATCQQSLVTEVPWAAGEGVAGGTGCICVSTAGLFKEWPESPSSLLWLIPQLP